VVIDTPPAGSVLTLTQAQAMATALVELVATAQGGDAVSTMTRPPWVTETTSPYAPGGVEEIFDAGREDQRRVSARGLGRWLREPPRPRTHDDHLEAPGPGHGDHRARPEVGPEGCAKVRRRMGAVLSPGSYVQQRPRDIAEIRPT
jgi:hypothetical protein